MNQERASVTKQRPRVASGRRGASEPVTRSRHPIRVMWTRTLVSMVVLVLGLGVTALGATLYQRHVFDQTTAQLEAELDATVSLVRVLRSVDVPMGGILYEFGTPAKLQAHVDAFNERRNEIDEAFDRALRVTSTGGRDGPLTSARADWNKTADAVLAAQDLWGTTVVEDALAAGRDPFSEEWTLLREAQGKVTELTAQSLDSLRARTAEVDRVQRLIPAIVLGTLVITIALGGWSARRLSQRVVLPVLAIRNAAVRMRDGDLQTTLRLDETSDELHDLAQAMNELAGSLHASYGRLRDQAYTDALTNLPNRKALTEQLNRRTQSETQGTGLLFIDLDDFKLVNDTLGHEAGDQLLTIVAARLAASARAGDLVVRLGGDEFAVALHDRRMPTAALAVARRILAALDAPVQVNGRSVTVGCSIGIAFAGADTVGGDELLRKADLAMYTAKAGGKHRVELYSDAMHADAKVRLNLKADLAHVVDRDELVLEYQPVVDLAAGRVLGWEALVRWQHPERGRILPDAFIPLAEVTGDIVNIGGWVLDRACQDFAGVRGGVTTDRWLSVNVSAQQLLEPHFADAVSQSLQRCGMKPGSLVLEITESALIDDGPAAAATLATLQRSGVRIAIDDFGTGMSSLWRLQEFPVDIIKIDRSFVSRAASQQSGGMLQAIVTLGATLGLDMIVEGIERRGELEVLNDFPRLAAQGYFFARPMPWTQAQAQADTFHSPQDHPPGDAQGCERADWHRVDSPVDAGESLLG